ncbi:alcohol dehydrogenase catalytic domain-containing protein [Streptomyces sp. NPDC008150]|uniref:NADP-dependent oxidoreductase n=1 Tax=Streptomyces sp. NPDC008150 TaxID=3364816 RepID=UPI0036E23B9F
MPNAMVMSGYGPPDVLRWSHVPLVEPGEGEIRIRVKAAGVSPTDLAIRSGELRFPLGDPAVLGYEVAGVVDAVGPGVTGTSAGDEVAAMLMDRGGYAEYALASAWAPKAASVSWTDAAAIPGSVEAAAGVLRQLGVKGGERLLIVGGGGSVGAIATQLAVAQGVEVVSAVGQRDDAFAEEIGARPVRYGAGLVEAVRALGPVDAVFDAAGTGVLADAVTLAGGPRRVITLSDHEAAKHGVTLSVPTADRAPGAVAEGLKLFAEGRLRLKERHVMPLRDAAEAHRLLENHEVRGRVVLTVD